ncbi:MAG: stage III sporulation protein AF [Clostridia bacterium]|nr:stage III sporulation protein AF [Clostridia bacterium]
MKAWIFSVCGIVFLGLMVDVISPNGKTNTFIKSIFSLIFLFVLASPLVKIINTKINFDEYSWNMNSDYMAVIKNQKIASLEQMVTAALQESGYDDIGVKIEGNLTNNELSVTKVYVILKNNVLTDSAPSINNGNTIKDIIAVTLSVDKEVIVF